MKPYDSASTEPEGLSDDQNFRVGDAVLMNGITYNGFGIIAGIVQGTARPRLLQIRQGIYYPELARNYVELLPETVRHLTLDDVKSMNRLPDKVRKAQKIAQLSEELKSRARAILDALDGIEEE